MVVCDDVAVLRDGKARAARRVFHYLTEVVGRGGGHVDGNDAVDIRGIDLRHRKLRTAADLHGGDLRHLAVADLHAGMVDLRAENGVAHASADQTAEQRAAQRQRRDLQSAAVFLLRLFLPRLIGVILDVHRLIGVCVPLAVVVMIEIVFILVIHAKDLLFIGNRLCGLLTIHTIRYIYVFFLNNSFSFFKRSLRMRSFACSLRAHILKYP